MGADVKPGTGWNGARELFTGTVLSYRPYNDDT